MTTLKTVAIMTWIAASTVCYSAPDDLKIVMFDYAGTSHAVLVSAAGEARHVLEAVGVETAWTVCQVTHDASQHCELPARGTYLEVKILPPALDSKLPKYDALAYAIHCPAAERCSTSYLFHGPVLALARDAGRPVSLAMAYVMAHEISHLMGLEHSEGGIMKARFERNDLREADEGRLHFTDSQTGSLRASVALWTRPSPPMAVGGER